MYRPGWVSAASRHSKQQRFSWEVEHAQPPLLRPSTRPPHPTALTATSTTTQTRSASTRPGPVSPRLPGATVMARVPLALAEGRPVALPSPPRGPAGLGRRLPLLRGALPRPRAVFCTAAAAASPPRPARDDPTPASLRPMPRKVEGLAGELRRCWGCQAWPPPARSRLARAAAAD